MNSRRTNAIFIKQLQDTIKNKAILVQFLMFPVMASILSLSVSDFGLGQFYFVNMFSAMYTTMAPIIVLSTVISEEKEQGSLKLLMMSNVKPIEYMLGISAFILTLCSIGVIFMGIVGGYTGMDLAYFILTNIMGILLSILVGSCVGLRAKNQSSATSLSVPIMLLFSFVPMLSMFNPNIASYGKILYSQQVSNMLTDIANGVFSLTIDSGLIILANGIIFLTLYIISFRKILK